jgi:tetratricopeptide (TPR) repeat protein
MIALFCLLLAASSPSAAGAQLLREGRAAEALPLLEQAQQQNPKDAAVATELGAALLRLGRRAEAEDRLRAAIALDPRRPFAYALLAGLLTDDPRRWDLADETLALLDRGIARARGEVARATLQLARVDFLRAVGRTADARSALDLLRPVELPAAQERRLAEVGDRLAADEQLRAREDWPEPPTTDDERSKLARGEERLEAGDPRGALATAEMLCEAQRAWRAPRWLRARALEELGRLDEAVRELGILVQLAPSHAPAWRKLGELLAEHGGLLEADRADEALRRALALEPSWTGLWLTRARVALRRGRPADAIRELTRLSNDHSAPDAEAERLLQLARAQLDVQAGATAEPARAAEPTPEARELLRQAQEASASSQGTDAALALLARALDVSPGFVEAAAAWAALRGEIPARTREALWSDGAALVELASQIQRARPAEGAVLAAPLLDRAAELGFAEALYERALVKMARGDRPGALADLTDYAAAAPLPRHLEEARILRAQLVVAPRNDPAELQARERLAEDRPDAALATLGGQCEPGRPGRTLLLLARVREYSGDVAEALACYRAALAAEPGSKEALERLARVAARAKDEELEPYAPELRAAAASGIAAAEWALARSALAGARPQDALPHLQSFLGSAAPGEPGLAAARAARERLSRANDAAARAQSRRRFVGSVAVGVLVLAALAAWLRGSTVARALKSRPRLYPAVARSVAALRHDVLKHRASVLAMARDPAARQEVARALLDPEPASRAVAREYERLRQDGRAHGVILRPLRREPAFGNLFRDLAAAEALLRAGSTRMDRIAAIDARIREVHGPRLAALLRLGPRTRVSARELEGWIRGVEAEVRRGGSGWVSPSILVQGMEVEFPVERDALTTIFTNLLRNAQAAAAPEGRVLVRLGEERDAAGRSVRVLLVGDSAESDLTLEGIESRESGRGLAIVRDLTREWHGHLVVRPESAPLRKVVGACFPDGGAGAQA